MPVDGVFDDFCDLVLRYFDRIAIGDGGINFVFQGFRYRVPVCGAVQSTNKGFRISGDRIELDLSCADR